MSSALFGCYHPIPCNQSALITHSPGLFSQRLSLTPMSVTFAQVCLWWTSLYNMWHESLPPLGSLLSAQGHQVNQISFHCLQSLYWCSFLSFSSWLNTRVANVLPLDIFFFCLLYHHRQLIYCDSTLVFIYDPKYLSLSNYPLTLFSCNCLVNEFINQSCWHFF